MEKIIGHCIYWVKRSQENVKMHLEREVQENVKFLWLLFLMGFFLKNLKVSGNEREESLEKKY